MLDDKRKYTRVDVPLIIEFKPLKDEKKFFWGLMRNFSYEGFSFESSNVNISPKERMEFKLKFPQKGTFVSVLGDVVWKRQIENKCQAGIKLKDMNEQVRREILGKICDYGNISTDRIFSDNKPVHEKLDKVEKQSKKAPKEPDSKGKSVKKLLKTFFNRSQDAGIKKQYLKSKPVCKVTFRLPNEAAPAAQEVTIVGEFNNWNTTSTPMKRMKNGDFTITLELPGNKEYRFRYLIDGTRWENDWCADKYLPNDHGSEDSIVVV